MSSDSNKKTKTGLWALCIKIGLKLLTFAAKLLKFTKVGLAAVTFASYSVLFSWQFAILLMVSIGWHESGHIFAMKKLGLKTRGFFYLPLLGGVAVSEDKYKTYEQNVIVAIMGPLWGTLLAYLAAWFSLFIHAPWLGSAAAFMALINIFNLLPVHPLDGGQIIKAIAFSISRNTGIYFLVASMVAGIAIMFYLHMYLFAILLIACGIELVIELLDRKRHKQYGDELTKLPDAMTGKQMLIATAAYIINVAMLVLLLTALEYVPGADLIKDFLE